MIKRYDIDHPFDQVTDLLAIESQNGEWVRFEDIAHLLTPPPSHKGTDENTKDLHNIASSLDVDLATLDAIPSLEPQSPAVAEFDYDRLLEIMGLNKINLVAATQIERFIQGQIEKMRKGERG